MTTIGGILGIMNFTPKQNWNLYDEAVRNFKSQRDQNLSTSLVVPSPAEGLRRYAEYFDLLQTVRLSLRKQGSLNWANASEARWREKIAMRIRLIGIYRDRKSVV